MKNSSDRRALKMMQLSFAAYCNFVKDRWIAKMILKVVLFSLSRQRLIWGPYSLKVRKNFVFNNALIYIVQDLNNPDEYTVVIRGTNLPSFYSWFKQDLEVNETVSWEELLEQTALTGTETPHPGVDPELLKKARVSLATANSLRYHLDIVDHRSREPFYVFLEKLLRRKKGPVTLNFTGHSMGGLLAPTLALWYIQKWYKPDMTVNAYGFAGPTAGNEAFAKLNCDLVNCVNYRNKRDLAVNAWNKSALLNLKTFLSHYFEKEKYLGPLLDHIINSTEGEGYALLGGEEYDIKTENVFPEVFLFEVAYQHTIAYITAFFEVGQETRSRYFDVVKRKTAKIISTNYIKTLGGRMVSEISGKKIPGRELVYAIKERFSKEMGDL